jgi:hypothetical protein
MKEFNNPNITGPRYRPEVYNVMNQKFFDSFREKYPKYKHLDNSQLKKIGKTFNQAIYHGVIDNRDGIELPEQIGWLFIGTCQQSKKQNTDFAKSKQYGVRVSNNNWATDGKLAKIFFSNFAPKHKIKHREYWKFEACREFKRSVAKTYPENWNIYVEVEPTKQAKTTYTKTYHKDLMIKKTAEALKTYKDFDI